ncbi:Ice-binding protein [Candidatus Nanopelagicaceae bacterium]
MTYGPGVYRSTAALGLAGEVILDGHNHLDSQFVFVTNAAFTTAASSDITLINGAQPANVFWVSAGAITTGAGSDISGNFLSESAITLGAGSVVHGDLFSNTAITFGAGVEVIPSVLIIAPTPSLVTNTPITTETVTAEVIPSVLIIAPTPVPVIETPITTETVTTEVIVVLPVVESETVVVAREVEPIPVAVVEVVAIPEPSVAIQAPQQVQSVVEQLPVSVFESPLVITIPAAIEIPVFFPVPSSVQEILRVDEVVKAIPVADPEIFKKRTLIMTIYFTKNSSFVDAKSLVAMKNLVSTVAKKSVSDYEIRGYAITPTGLNNRTLSSTRVQVINSILIKNKITSSKKVIQLSSNKASSTRVISHTDHRVEIWA